MQVQFGSGNVWATPLTDYAGNAVSNPTPITLGVLQDVAFDSGFDIKKLYGQNQFPVAIGRGKGSISVKAKFAQINGALLNSIIFGQSVSNGILSDNYDTTGAAIPSTPFQITPTVPSSGTWSRDLGVINASGVPMTRVASGPATGQYSVSAGVYTFAAADTGLTVFINYAYTATSTTAKKSTVVNAPMGYAPTVGLDLYDSYNAKSIALRLYSCTSSKLSLASKLDDFWIPEIDFEVFANSSGQVLDWGTTE